MSKIDRRKKDITWNVTDDNGNTRGVEFAMLAVLMDIRDELQTIRKLASCYRIPRALDAMHELGVEARRRKRDAAKRRKAANSVK